LVDDAFRHDAPIPHLEAGIVTSIDLPFPLPYSLNRRVMRGEQAA